jgi:hypothetical protein
MIIRLHMIPARVFIAWINSVVNNLVFLGIEECKLLVAIFIILVFLHAVHTVSVIKITVAFLSCYVFSLSIWFLSTVGFYCDLLFSVRVTVSVFGQERVLGRWFLWCWIDVLFRHRLCLCKCSYLQCLNVPHFFALLRYPLDEFFGWRHSFSCFNLQSSVDRLDNQPLLRLRLLTLVHVGPYVLLLSYFGLMFHMIL